MGSDIAKLILDFLKLAPRYLVAVGIFAAVLVLSGRQFLERLGVTEFAEHHRAALGLVLIGVCAVVAASFGAWCCGKVAGCLRQRKMDRRTLKRLHALTEDEKQILRFYIWNQTRTNTLRFTDGVVQGLVTDGVIVNLVAIGTRAEGFAYNISEFAWEHLNRNPHLLEGITTSQRTDKSPEWSAYF